MKKDNDRLFEGFARPLPPTDLRERTLRLAGTALMGPARRDVWGRVWESVLLRLVWTGAVAVLLASHVVISTAEYPNARRSGKAAMLSVADDGDELFEIVDLARITTSRPGLMGFREASDRPGKRISKGDVS